MDATGEPNPAGSAVHPEGTPAPRVSVPPPPMGRALLAALAALFGTAMLGTALAPFLAVHHPLILIALNPYPRHIILVAAHTPMIALVAVAASRSLISCVISYEVGRHYGPKGVQLFERKSPRMGSFVRGFEKVFRRAAPAFLVLAPGPLTSTLAAISGNSRWATFTLSGTGLAAWAFAYYTLGDWLKPYTGEILGFIQRHLLVTTVACAVLVLGYQVLRRQRRLRKGG